MCGDWHGACKTRRPQVYQSSRLVPIGRGVPSLDTSPDNGSNAASTWKSPAAGQPRHGLARAFEIDAPLPLGDMPNWADTTLPVPPISKVRGNLKPNSVPTKPGSRVSARQVSSGMSPPRVVVVAPGYRIDRKAHRHEGSAGSGFRQPASDPLQTQIRTSAFIFGRTRCWRWPLRASLSIV